MGTVTTEVGNASVSAAGQVTKTIDAAGNAQVYAIEGITSPTIKAGGNANVMTYENIKSDVTTTGGNIWVDAGTDVDGKVDAQLNAIVRSRTTTISKDVVSEAADATAIALDSLSANDCLSRRGGRIPGGHCWQRFSGAECHGIGARGQCFPGT